MTCSALPKISNEDPGKNSRTVLQNRVLAFAMNFIFTNCNRVELKEIATIRVSETYIVGIRQAPLIASDFLKNNLR